MKYYDPFKDESEPGKRQLWRALIVGALLAGVCWLLVYLIAWYWPN